MGQLPSRQIHLDFHTSEFIPGVGAKFSKENFQQALKLGHVNSITVFAKCHHSWCYYPTKVGAMHPSLDFDLTGAMIEAAHEIGVHAPVYITVGWSSNDAEKHPEWVVTDINGNKVGYLYDFNAKPNDRKIINSWIELCPNGGYADHIYELTREVCNRYSELDGLFYDINFHNHLCYCDACLKGMKKLGLDYRNKEDARKYFVHKWKTFASNCRAILMEKHKETTIFFNGGAKITEPEWHEYQSHFEMEDLPTSWGGYDKLPVRAKYFARTGKEYLGMSGKFHTFWGEFGGFKSFNAMKYECAAMSAFGAKCSMGDQLHPSGEMDLETYRLIGHGYEYVEKIELWCYDVEETTRLGVYISNNDKTDEGLVKMLLDAHLDFDVVRDATDLERFDTVILPDCVCLDDSEAQALKAFIEHGGGVLLTGKSGLSKTMQEFAVDVGANYQGPSLYEVDYLQASSQLNSGLIKTPFLFYEGAERVLTTDGEVLATLRDPYFNRTNEHFCSHQYTPYRLEESPSPAAVRKGRVVYLAHTVCKQYYEFGAQLHRDYFINALKLIYTKPVLEVSGLPSCGRVRFVHQKEQNRYILHLLYGPPIQRGKTLVIEDLPSVFGIDVKVRISEKVKKVYLAPQEIELPFFEISSDIVLKVPELHCHQIVVIDVMN